MLNRIRKHTQAWLIKIILGAIIAVFVFWGIGTIRSQRADTVAEVNGRVITRTDYQKAYSSALKNYQQVYGDAFSEELLKKMNLEKAVLDALIREILVEQGSAELNLRVSDEEIKEYIRRMPVFNEGGRFNEERYGRILANARLTPAAFEEGLRKELLWAKVSQTLGRFAKVSEDEAWSAFQYANRQIDLTYVPFPAAAFKNKVKTDESDLREYFNGHREDYRVPTRVRVRYARFLFKDYADKVRVSPEEIEDYYKINREEFKEPERRRVSHIFFALNPSMTGEEVTKVQAKAEEVLTKAKAGEDFAGLARRFSQDKSAMNAGDLGYLQRGVTEPSFEESVFTLQKGSLSPVVRSSAGLHIIKVTDVIPSTVRPLAAVQSNIKKILAGKKVQEVTVAEAAKAYEQIIRVGGLERYARAQKISLLDTDFFSEEGEVKGIGHEVSFNRAALALKKGELSSLIKLPRGYFVCEVMERKDSFVPEFGDVSAKLKADFVESQALHLAESEANGFVSELKAGRQHAELVHKHGLSAHKTGYINPASLSGSEFPLARSAGELAVLTPAHSYIQHPIKAGDVFYVVSLAGVKEAPKEIYDAQRQGIKERLLLTQREEILKEWLDGLRRKAKIEYGGEFEKYR